MSPMSDFFTNVKEVTHICVTNVNLVSPQMCQITMALGKLSFKTVELWPEKVGCLSLRNLSHEKVGYLS